MFGPYDENPPLWGLDGVPADYAGELLPPDLEATLPHFERAVVRVPRLGTVGIKTCVSGPIAVTPDNRPLVGPAWGFENFWLAEGFTGGIAMGGGIGHSLAEWIVAWRARHRSSRVRSAPFRRLRQRSVTRASRAGRPSPIISASIFRIGNGRPRGRSRPRPAMTSWSGMGRSSARPMAGKSRDGSRPKGVERKDRHSYRRSNSFEHVGEECRAVRERVGLYDLTPAAKYELSGQGPRPGSTGSSRPACPTGPARIALGYVLTPAGGVLCELTVTCLAEDHFYLVGPTVAERHHFDVLAKALPRDGSVSLRNVTSALRSLRDRRAESPRPAGEASPMPISRMRPSPGGRRAP